MLEALGIPQQSVVLLLVGAVAVNLVLAIIAPLCPMIEDKLGWLFEEEKREHIPKIRRKDEAQ